LGVGEPGPTPIGAGPGRTVHAVPEREPRRKGIDFGGRDRLASEALGAGRRVE
jgi:hypothetical protein